MSTDVTALLVQERITQLQREAALDRRSHGRRAVRRHLPLVRRRAAA